MKSESSSSGSSVPGGGSAVTSAGAVDGAGVAIEVVLEPVPHFQLILVLGHTRCGAVKATCDLEAKGADAVTETGLTYFGHITESIVEAINRYYGSATTESESVDSMLRSFLEQFPARVDEFENLLTAGDELSVNYDRDAADSSVFEVVFTNDPLR